MNNFIKHLEGVWRSFEYIGSFNKRKREFSDDGARKARNRLGQWQLILQGRAVASMDLFCLILTCPLGCIKFSFLFSIFCVFIQVF